MRAHYASLQPDAVLTTSVMEGYGFPDYCPASIRLHGVLDCAILYDLTPLILSEQFLVYPPHVAFYERQLEVLKRADLLLAISESSRTDAIRLLGAEGESIANIRAAAATIFSKAPRLDRRELLPTESYVLFAGGVDPNKNVRLVAEAFARLPAELQTKHRLVHVGAMSEEGRQSVRKAARHAGTSEILFSASLTTRR